MNILLYYFLLEEDEELVEFKLLLIEEGEDEVPQYTLTIKAIGSGSVSYGGETIREATKTYKVNDGVSLDSTSSYIKESRVEFYSHDWNRPIRILNESYMNPMEISKASRTVLEGEGGAKNAFGSAEARESSTVKSIASRRKLDDFAPVFWEIKIDPSKKVLVYNANCPMLTQEEKKRLKEENKLTEFNYEVNLLNIF